MNNHRHLDGSLKIASLKGWVIAYVIVAILLAAKACAGPDPIDQEQAMYCEMVALNKQDPSVGWPDYNHNYQEVCANAR